VLNTESAPLVPVLTPPEIPPAPPAPTVTVKFVAVAKDVSVPVLNPPAPPPPPTSPPPPPPPATTKYSTSKKGGLTTPVNPNPFAEPAPREERYWIKL
jgi:hypothetical protein